MPGDKQKTGFELYGYTPSPTGSGTYTGSGSASDPVQLDGVTVTAPKGSGSSVSQLIDQITNFKLPSASSYFNAGGAAQSMPPGQAGGDPNSNNGSQRNTLITILLIAAALFAIYFMFLKK